MRSAALAFALVLMGLAPCVSGDAWYVPIVERVSGGFDHIQLLMAYPYEFDSPAMSAFGGPSPVGEQWSQMFLDQDQELAIADGPTPGPVAISLAVWVAGDRQFDRPTFHFQAYKGQTLVDNADFICFGPGELDWMVGFGTWDCTTRISGLYPGDANKDGKVDYMDLGILATYYRTESGAVWGMADFTGDGAVDYLDLGILANYYRTGCGAAVPEPVGLGLLALGIVAVTAGRRKTK